MMRFTDDHIKSDTGGIQLRQALLPLDEPGVIFSYTGYVRMLEANLPTLMDVFYSNIGFVG